MRKRLLTALLSAGLVGAMLPGVAVAEPRYDGCYVFFICDDHQRYAPSWEADLWYEGWPPNDWRSEVDWDLVEEGIDYLATEHSLDCRAGGVGWFYYPGTQADTDRHRPVPRGAGLSMFAAAANQTTTRPPPDRPPRWSAASQATHIPADPCTTGSAPAWQRGTAPSEPEDSASVGELHLPPAVTQKPLAHGRQEENVR